VGWIQEYPAIRWIKRYALIDAERADLVQVVEGYTSRHEHLFWSILLFSLPTFPRAGRFDRDRFSWPGMSAPTEACS